MQSLFYSHSGIYQGLPILKTGGKHTGCHLLSAYQGVRNIIFRKNFALILNGWSISCHNSKTIYIYDFKLGSDSHCSVGFFVDVKWRVHLEGDWIRNQPTPKMVQEWPKRISVHLKHMFCKFSKLLSGHLKFTLILKGQLEY